MFNDKTGFRETISGLACAVFCLFFPRPMPVPARKRVSTTYLEVKR